MNLRFQPESFAMSIRQASYDDAKREYLVEHDLPVYNLDDIKEYVCRNLRDNSFTKSVDAYYVREDGREYLIEFKNQNPEDVPRRAIKEKAYDSLYLLLLTFDQRKSLEETAKNVSLVVVYNEKASGIYQATHYNKSSSFDKMVQKFGQLAKAGNSRPIRFGISYLKGRLYREIYTVDVEDFLENFVKQGFAGID